MNRLLLALGIYSALGACVSEPKPVSRPPAKVAAPKPSASVKPAIAKPTSRASLGPIGSAHPVVAEAVSPEGSWAVYCQARTDSDGDGRIEVRVGARGALEGDALQRYLTIGGGEGQPIEELLASDANGRYLVVRRGGRALLLDSRSNNELDLSNLGADTRSELGSFKRHRAFGFDGSGARLVYLRKDSSGTRAIVRQLSDGAESAVESPTPDVYRVELDHFGRSALLHALIDDTNGDGRLTWPAPEAKSPPPCTGPIASYPAWVGRGDKPVVSIGSSSGGKAHPIVGFVTVLGEDMVLREPTGRLVLDQKGRHVELASAKCGARVVHANAERKLLVIACTGPKGRPKLELVGAGFRQELGIDVGAWTDDRPAGASARVVALYPGNDAVLLDLDTKKLTPLETGDRVVAIWQTRSLVRKKRGLSLLDSATGEKRELGVAPTTFVEPVVNAHVAVVAPFVVDLREARVVGRIDGRALAAAPDARVLVADGGTADATRLSIGPLVWRSPIAIAEAVH